ncbi:MAG TPA: phosphopantothenoylcysteine decarboxylase, partial [Candidatus Limnocylindrales bacterium]
LVEAAAIVAAVETVLAGTDVRAPNSAERPPTVVAEHTADLTGWRIVVTAGGTAEPIDPVRFIGNRSTGRMGVAVVEAALDRGATVTLIAANVSVTLPAAATVVRVESTGQMRAALLAVTTTPRGSAGFDALVMAAAVADFRPARPAETKLTRTESLTLELEPTPDLLAEVARIARGLDADGAATRRPLDPPPVLVGFAAETGSLDRAVEKLARKRVDLLVANDVTEPGSGFGTDTNRVTILAADGGREDLPLLPKREVADRLLDRVAAALDDRDTARQTAGRTEPAAAPVAEETPR